MSKSRIFAILSLVALTVVLAACGNEEDAEPTPVPTVAVETVEPTMKVEPTEVASTEVSASPIAATVPGRSAATPVRSTAGAASTPVMESAPAMPVDATFVFSGAEQRDYLATAEGCVGLGEWSQLQPGAQVIVRDASGTVVDVSTLGAGDSADECSWTTEINAPDSEFVSISIPMVTEVWFSQADLDSGVVEITVP